MLPEKATRRLLPFSGMEGHIAPSPRPSPARGEGVHVVPGPVLLNLGLSPLCYSLSSSRCHAVAEVFLSMVKNPMAVDVKQVIQELIVPELREMKAEMKGLQIEIKRLDEKIDIQGAKLDNKIEVLGVRLDEKIDAQGARVDDKISSLRNEILSEFRRLDEKVDLTVHVRERLVSLEARMAAYENRT